MGPAAVWVYCPLHGAGTSLPRAAVEQHQRTAAARHHILTPARTIADLAGSERIQHRPRRQFQAQAVAFVLILPSIAR
jgi:predicted ATPase with chaperone activity